MKKIIFSLIIFAFGIFVGLNIYSKYDANRDGKITAKDYIVIKKFIMKEDDEKCNITE